jgi:hypothetical protein
MALKTVLDSLEGVPSELHKLYVQKDGKYVLDAEGIEDVSGLKSALERKKQEAADAKKAAKELKEQLESLGMEPDEIKAIIADHQKAKDKKLIDEGKVDEIVTTRVAKLKKEYDDKLTAITGERNTLHGKLSEVLIDSALKDVAVKAKVRSTAMEDVLLRGKRIWTLKENQPVALNGEEAIFGKDGKPISMLEWVNELQTSAPHLFEGSSGGGANGSGGNGGGGNGGMKLFSAASPNAIGENLAAFAKGEARLTE